MAPSSLTLDFRGVSWVPESAVHLSRQIDCLTPDGLRELSRSDSGTGIREVHVEHTPGPFHPLLLALGCGTRERPEWLDCDGALFGWCRSAAQFHGSS